MNVKEMKSLELAPDEKRSLGPQDAIVLKVKNVRQWFGKEKEHVGLSLEDASGEWISAAVFNAPSEIAKMEGEWIPVEPSPGQMSGVWLEGEEYTARSGPKAGQTIRSIGLKIMGGCFRWDKALSGPPQAPPPAQATHTPPQAGSAPQGASPAVERQGAGQPALPLAEYQRWWLARWEWYEGSPVIQRAISRGEAVARTIRDAIGAEWMSQSPYDRNIERSTPSPPPVYQGSYGQQTSQAEPSRYPGPGYDDSPGDGSEVGSDDDDIPF